MRRLAAAVLVLLSAAAPAVADEATETRLREALRSATIQLRAAEDERTLLQAKLAAAEAARQALDAQVKAAAGKLAAAEQQAVVQAEAAGRLDADLAERAAALDKARGTIGQCRGALDQAKEAGRATAEARRNVAAQRDDQTRRAEACEAKNVQLYRLGEDLLDAYAKVGLGEVIARGEPFLGLKRVELENLAQDYQDKLLDGKVAP